MKKIKNWVYGGITGVVIGTTLFFIIALDQFMKNIGEFRVWLGFLVIVLEPTIAGALIPFLYNRLSKLRIKKIIFWIIYSLMVLVLVYITVWWFIALDLVMGIVGL